LLVDGLLYAFRLIMPRDASDLLHGTLDVLVLKTLTSAPMHGYAIAEWIEKHGGGELVIVDAALYKSLHRLAESGAIASEWGLSENNRKAKYYSLTPRGRAQLRAETATWRRYASAVGRILETT
jgi:transcriptional regulator